MLVVATIAKARRAHSVQGKSIKAICRELNLSRKVVRKVLRSAETAFEYERRVQPLPKIGPVRETLDRLLAANEAKPARERLTLIRLFEELRIAPPSLAGARASPRQSSGSRHAPGGRRPMSTNSEERTAHLSRPNSS